MVYTLVLISSTGVLPPPGRALSRPQPYQLPPDDHPGIVPPPFASEPSTCNAEAMEAKVVKEEPDVQNREAKIKVSEERSSGSPGTRSEDSQSPPSPSWAVGEGNRLKRLLSTLVQYGQEIAPETGDRVRALVIALAGGAMGIEEFQQCLHDVTSFPLRPFVLPYLRAYLPPLQKDIALQARNAKQSVLEFLSSHEHLVLDPTFSPGQSSEVFHSREEPAKRRFQDGCSEGEECGPTTSKRQLLVPVHPLASTEQPQPQTFQPRATPLPSHHDQEQWKSIETMLNCILSMVEKTKKALRMLQGRNGFGGVVEDWNDPKRLAGEMMAHTIRLAEDRVAQVRRKAEEAVAEVKRQAVVELQRAVAESKVMASAVPPIRPGDSSRLHPSDHPHQEPHSSCWNCGRKASETCSGCNLAKYCGPFCQHKDWESHHVACSGGTKPQKQAPPPPLPAK